MPQAVIDNPILNSPFDEPTRHFRFDEQGITNDIVETRRISSYFTPIAQPKQKGKTGEARKDKAAKVTTAQTLWVPAVNSHGGFGRWAFVEVTDPWDAQRTIRAAVLAAGATVP